MGQLIHIKLFQLKEVSKSHLLWQFLLKLSFIVVQEVINIKQLLINRLKLLNEQNVTKYCPQVL